MKNWIKYTDCERKHICNYCGYDFLLKRIHNELKLIMIKSGSEYIDENECVVSEIVCGRECVTHYIDGRKVPTEYKPLLFYGDNSYDVKKNKVFVGDDCYEVNDFIENKVNQFLHNIYSDVLSFTSYRLPSHNGRPSDSLELGIRECIADWVLKTVKYDVYEYIANVVNKYIAVKQNEYRESIAKKQMERAFINNLQREFFGVS